MVNPYATTAVILGCLLPGGCGRPTGGNNMSAVEGQHFEGDIGGLGPIEVQEQYYPNGNVSVGVEGYVDRDGNFVRHGVTTNFWENGQKKSQVHYVQGMRHGSRTAWYQGGQIWSDGQFVNGREDGTLTVWFPNGRKAKELNFDHGAWHGTGTEWHLNGRKKMEVEWVRGKRQGMLTIWDEEGNVFSQVEYADGVPQP
jgi:antitoxin component YwqK of YwqJK toxin-antitoxin module